MAHETRPVISVLIANYNGAAMLDSCLRSVLAQTLTAIEVIVVDDFSSDDSLAVVRRIAARDPRVLLFTSPVNGGPGAARNRGLDTARGRWIAVVDSDDLLHPERLQRLLASAEAAAADIAADNLLVFDDQGVVPPYVFMPDAGLPRVVDLAEYVAANAHGAGGPKLGYLKPLFRTDFVRASGVRYRPALRVGQDFGFVLSLMAAGARLHLFPGATYFFRRHPGSNSHRLADGNVHAMLDDDKRFLAAQARPADDLVRAFALRRRGFQARLAYDALVGAIKDRRWAAAAAMAIRHPRAAAMLREPLAVRARSRAHRPALAQPARPRVCIVTCSPFLDVTLDRLTTLAAALGRGGHDVHLVIPVALRAPRRLAIAQLPGIRQFASVDIRSGRSSAFLTGERWAAEDQLFVSQFARPHADIAIAEWQPGVDILPYVLRPDALSIMLVGGLPAEASTPAFAPAFAPEFARLARADAIMTFHAEDAALLYAACPGTPVVLLPGAYPFGDPPPRNDTRLDTFLQTLRG